MTEQKARALAHKLARRRGGTWFIVYDYDYILGERNSFNVADDFDLETWFAGVHPNNIVATIG